MTPCSSSYPTSPGHSRPTTPQRPANGLSNCPQCGANDCSSCAESSDMEDGVVSGNVEQPSASFQDTTCVAARTRPVRDVRHRRILRDSQVCQATRKAQRPVTTRCTCHWPTSCIVCCTGNVSRITLDPDAMSLHERVALLGQSFHPVLSLSHEIPLHIHLEALLRKAEAQHRGLHRTKGLAARKLLGKQWPVQVGSPFDRKLRHKLDLGISSTKCSWSKVALDKEQALCLDSPRQGASPLLFSDAEEEGIMHMRKRRRSGHLHLGAGKRRSGKSHPLCLNEAVEGSSGTHGRPLHSPALTEVLSSTSLLHGSHAVSTSNTPSSSIQSSLRKRRGESSFDINNIVIPLSMATTARVEKIQYKEILTPRWRIFLTKHLGHGMRSTSRRSRLAGISGIPPFIDAQGHFTKACRTDAALHNLLHRMWVWSKFWQLLLVPARLVSRCGCKIVACGIRCASRLVLPHLTSALRS
uniref:Uncharacterized protein n=1 Tax=Eptatretus burgeri TaxID=7764 RepID=A0A8C4Q2F0_EPTBU